MSNDLAKDTALERILNLILVQNYDRHNGYKFLTYYDRIQICKERSATQSYVNYLNHEIEKEAVKWFRVPDDLHKKIERIELLIKQQNYELKTELDN